MTCLSRAACVALAMLLAACSAEPGSERWCRQTKERPAAELSLADAGTYAAHCLLEHTTIGSDAWCARLAGRPKGEWTADEAASYAKHCLI